MSDARALGQRLREAREAKELSLADVEQATRIRLKYVEALEQGDYTSMTPVQAQGFLRNYARFLGLDLELLLRKNGSSISIKRACELTHNMYQVRITLPASRQKRTITLALSDEQKLLLAALN